MVQIGMQPGDFGAAPRMIGAWDGVVASAFASGVAGLRIVTPRAEVLPFQGQQVWDAVTGGRRLTMQTGVAQPLPTRDYRATNGALLSHS